MRSYAEITADSSMAAGTRPYPGLLPRVHQISVSSGGVPKTPVATAVIDDRGLVDDDQADKVHHGSPDQAICLYSLEVIQGLRSEGHPIEPGFAGENLTLSGVDWNDVVPGVRLTIGPKVKVEITDFTAPCSKNGQWFADGNYSRMLQRRHPGESRVYAKVLTGGVVSTGDVVLVG